MNSNSHSDGSGVQGNDLLKKQTEEGMNSNSNIGSDKQKVK